MRSVSVPLLLLLAAVPTFAQDPWHEDNALLSAAPGTPAIEFWTATDATDGSYAARLRRSDGVIELLHFDANHQFLSRHRRLSGNGIYGLPSAFRLTRFADGKLYEFTGTFGNEIAQVAEDGKTVWATGPLVPRRPQGPYPFINHVLAASDSTLWVSIDDHRDMVIRIDSVGRPTTVWTSSTGDIDAMALAEDGGVVFSTSGSTTRVTKLDSAGQHRWTARPELPSNSAIEGLLTSADGMVTAIAQRNHESPLQVIEFSDVGGEISRSLIEVDLPPLAIQSVQWADTGSIIVVADAPELSDLIFQLSPNGTVDWQFALPPNRSVPRVFPGGSSLLPTESGGVRFITIEFPEGEGSYRYHHYELDGAGELIAVTALPETLENAGFVPREAFGDFLVTGQPGLVNQLGMYTRLTPESLLVDRERPKVLAAHSDGEHRFAVLELSSGRQLHAWHRDGSLRWVRALSRPPGIVQLPVESELQVSDLALCWQALDSTAEAFIQSQVECFDRESGLAGIRFDALDAGTFDRSQVLLQGGVIARLIPEDDTLTLRFESAITGADIRPSVTQINPVRRIHGEPGGIGVALDRGFDLEVYWLDGVEPATQIVPSRFGAKQVLPGGVRQQREWFPRGSDLEATLFTAGDVPIQSAAAASPMVIVWSDGSRLQLRGIDEPTGAVLWESVVDTLAPGSWFQTRLSDSELPNQVVVAVNGDLDFDYLRIDRLTGAQLESRSFPCPAAPCEIFLDGRIHGHDGLSLMLLRQQDDTAAALRSIRIDDQGESAIAGHSGVSGLWYHPALQGQGLVLTYDDQTRSLFSPWFTYSFSERENNDADNSWYSLQGQANGIDGLVELGIFQNDNGVFDSPPVTSAVQIGSARMHFHSCDQATLQYRIGERPQVVWSNTLPLVRLGKRSNDCVLTDSSTVPATFIADRAGFSTRQSGAWFNPATSGQGLMIEVTPATDQDAGLLFAAWFTYDLAESSNDFLKQDWFILQSDLSAGSNGQITLPIYRSVGGTHAYRATNNLFRVGEATLAFADCDQLSVSYRFDSSALASEHAGIEGEMRLQRIGGCQ